MVSTIQSIIFDRKYWSSIEARKWISKHNLRPIKPAHLTKNKIRFRLEDPKLFNRFRIKRLPNNIELVIGFY